MVQTETDTYTCRVTDRDTEKGKVTERPQREKKADKGQEADRQPDRRDRKTQAEAIELVTGQNFRAMKYRGHVAIWKVGS